MLSIMDHNLLVSDMLKQMGIHDSDDLAQRSSTYRSRLNLARQIADWIATADLSRIKGLDKKYIRLLWACEVKTTRELVYRSPKNLAAELKITNRELDLVKQLPSVNKIAGWIEQAKELTTNAKPLMQSAL